MQLRSVKGETKNLIGLRPQVEVAVVMRNVSSYTGTLTRLLVVSPNLSPNLAIQDLRKANRRLGLDIKARDDCVKLPSV